MAPTRSSQAGSAGSVLVLAIIAILVWWQWDRISGFFTSSGGDYVAEVTGFTCTASPSGTRFDGRVRNLSDKPYEFRALVNINDTSGRRYDSRETAVRPSPVPPANTGAFYGDGPAIPDGGSCKLDGVLDATTGYPVKHRRR